MVFPAQDQHIQVLYATMPNEDTPLARPRMNQEGEPKGPLRPFFGIPSDNRGGQPALTSQQAKVM